MSNDVLIKKEVESFIMLDRLFTSLDVSNSIKKTGVWIRNIEVRNWLRKNFSDEDLFGDYVRSQIKVCKGQRKATLYHPVWKSPTEYKDRDQQALKPGDVRSAKQQTAPLPTQQDDDDVVVSKVIRSVERIKIPGVIVRKLGWQPGEQLSSEKAALIKADSALPARLRINKDYRLSIPRSAVNWGTAPVKVMLKSGEVVFEKA